MIFNMAFVKSWNYNCCISKIIFFPVHLDQLFLYSVILFDHKLQLPLETYKLKNIMVNKVHLQELIVENHEVF